jgi:beta-glucanase (GH16 family)
VKTGILAARIKFAQGQGMHGSVWLQSDKGSEIDMIESFGYGRGLTSVVHVDGQRYPTAEDDIYVNTAAVRDRAWWSRFHVYTAEWTIDEVVFRIDGIETQRIVKTKADTDYFVVASMLSSDWEQVRFAKPVLDAPGVTPMKPPQTMSVAWVRVWTPA